MAALSADQATGRARIAAAENAARVAGRPGGLALPVVQALRFIEGHLREEVRLGDIASVAGLSRFQLSRTFVAVTGMPVMHYVRGRRLSEAARSLADGASDILSVALNWGYGSHEAFTRAFCNRFSVTPERLRACGSLNDLNLTQALVTGNIRTVELAPPCVRYGGPLLIAGMRQRYIDETNPAIPMLWHSFVRRMHEVPHRAGTYTYGLCCNNDHEGGFDYVAGVEVHRLEGLPSDFVHAQLPRRKYAVFIHQGHISGIRATMYSIWSRYLPGSGFRLVEAPDFERYTEAFNPRTGDGEVEIWIPVTTSQ
jgi:AraC family transcriptional regulator